MKKIVIYNGDKIYMFPNGALATPKIMSEKYPAIDMFKHAIQTDENNEVIYGISNWSAMRSRYNINPALSDDEAIVAIEAELNKEPAVHEGDNLPSATERIAAALEYQNLLAMEDVM